MEAKVKFVTDTPWRLGVNRRSTWNLRRRQSIFGMLLTLPAILMIVLFIGYPVVYSFLLTFSKFSIQDTQWFDAGVSNYQNVWANRSFQRALDFTLRYTLLYTPLSVFLALLISVLLQQIRVGGALFRSVLFLPTVIPITMGLLMFQWVLDPNWGVLNFALRDLLGKPEWTQRWLDDPDVVLKTLTGITLWGFGPWILLLAGLFSIPKELYEAARIDGAGPIREFRYITLPLLRNSLLVVTVLQLIKALKLFVPIYILTQGGPATKTRSLYFLVFQQINRGAHNYAEASTAGWIFAFIIIGITLAGLVVMRIRVRKEAGKWRLGFGTDK